jgi:hypothetical protein
MEFLVITVSLCRQGKDRKTNTCGKKDLPHPVYITDSFAIHGLYTIYKIKIIPFRVSAIHPQKAAKIPHTNLHKNFRFISVSNKKIPPSAYRQDHSVAYISSSELSD